MKQQESSIVKADPIATTVQKMEAEWGKMLPRGATSPERFARMALSCIRKNDKLKEAMSTQHGKLSTLSALATMAELGLEPDGRRVHLIPYKNEVTLIIDYKGLAELVMRSGLVSTIHADKVCDNDLFEYNMGDIIQHKIDFRQDRGNAYAYYCKVTMKDGTSKCEVMQRSEIEKVRIGSPGRDSKPWKDWYDEMAKKTVFRRLSKWLKLSPEVDKAVEIDEEPYKAKNITPFNNDSGLGFDDVSGGSKEYVMEVKAQNVSNKTPHEASEDDKIFGDD